MTGLAGIGLGARLLGLRSALSRISPKVWLAIGAAVALLAGVLWHQHVSHKRLKAADAAGYARAQAEDAKVIAAMRLRAQTAEANGLKISQEVRTRNDTQARNIRAAADTLSLRGPGAASCRRIGDPAVPASPGGHVAASGAADAAVDPVPDRKGIDLIGLPFAELVDHAKQCDLNRAEVLSWREADQRQRAEWENLRKKP